MLLHTVVFNTDYIVKLEFGGGSDSVAGRMTLRTEKTYLELRTSHTSAYDFHSLRCDQMSQKKNNCL